MKMLCVSECKVFVIKNYSIKQFGNHINAYLSVAQTFLFNKTHHQRFFNVF